MQITSMKQVKTSMDVSIFPTLSQAYRECWESELGVYARYAHFTGSLPTYLLLQKGAACKSNIRVGHSFSVKKSALLISTWVGMHQPVFEEKQNNLRNNVSNVRVQDCFLDWGSLSRIVGTLKVGKR